MVTLKNKLNGTEKEFESYSKLVDHLWDMNDKNGSYHVIIGDVKVTVEYPYNAAELTSYLKNAYGLKDL